MKKQTILKTIFATTLATTLLTTSVFAEQESVKYTRKNMDTGELYEFTLHMSDGVTKKETLTYNGEEALINFVADGTKFEIEYPKNVFRAGELPTYLDTMMFISVYQLEDGTYAEDGVAGVTSALYNDDEIVKTTGEYTISNSNGYVGLVVPQYFPETNQYGEFIFVVDEEAKPVSGEIKLGAKDKTENKKETSEKTTNTKTTNTKTTNTKTSNVKVGVNGVELKEKAIVKNGVSYLPARTFVKQAFDGGVQWDAKANTVTVYAKDNVITYKVGSNDYKINGKERKLDKNVTALFENGTAYIPVRATAESLGMSVNFDKKTDSIIIK